MTIKRITAVICSLSICALAAPAAFAASSRVEAVTISDLVGSDVPAIVVSNPLYGFIDMLRGVKDPFVAGRVGKLSSRLSILDRKAAELLKMRDVAPGNAKLIGRAVTEYQVAVYQYGVAASQVTIADIDASAADFVGQVVADTITHLRLLDELLAGSATTANQAVIGDMLDDFADTSVKLFDGSFDLDKVATQLANGKMEPLSAVRQAEMLAILAKHAAGLGYTDAAQRFLSVRVSLLDMVASEYDSSGFADFSLLVGSQAERIQTISYLLSRPELMGNSDMITLRNQLLIQVFSK